MKLKGIGKRQTAMLVVTAVILTVVAVALIITLVGKSDGGGTPAPEREVLRYGDYKYVIKQDQTVEIVGYLGAEKKLELPIMISGRNVTSVADEAFAGSKITDIVLGIFIESIGAYRVWCLYRVIFRLHEKRQLLRLLRLRVAKAWAFV